MLIYVDDLAITDSDSVIIGHFKTYLSECFHMKDLSKLKYFLGIEVARNSDGIFLNQRKYTLDIIQEVGLLCGKSVAFLMEQQHTLHVAKGPHLADSERYRHLEGTLIYLLATRPKLIYSVHI